MSDSLITFLVNTPIVIPLAGAATAVIITALIGLLVWGLLLMCWPDFRLVVLSSGGGGGKQRNNTATLVIVTFPGIASFFAGTVALFTNTVEDLVNSLAQLLSGDIVRFAALLVLGVLAGYTIQNHDVVAKQLTLFQTRNLNDILDWGKEILNLLRFGAGAVWPGFVNVPWFFLHGLAHVALHVVRDCLLESEPWAIVTDVVVDLATAIKEWFLAWKVWLDAGDLIHGRPDFVPAYTALGDVPGALGGIVNCTCTYIGTPFQKLLDVTQDPTFAAALDCGTNAFVRLFQEIFLSIDQVRTRASPRPPPSS